MATAINDDLESQQPGEPNNNEEEENQDDDAPVYMFSEEER